MCRRICGFIQGIFHSHEFSIAPIKRDRKIPWPIVKRKIIFVTHVKISWFFFSVLIAAFSYLEVSFCLYVFIMTQFAAVVQSLVTSYGTSLVTNTSAIKGGFKLFTVL